MNVLFGTKRMGSYEDVHKNLNQRNNKTFPVGVRNDIGF